MDVQAFINRYWACVARQDADSLADFFHPDARIFWHCTNEQFTVNEFIRANCEYPGVWSGTVERLERSGDGVISVARVTSGGQSFHAVSFFQIQEGRIERLDEYWGDDGDAPEWRREIKIGRPIDQG